jgi:hypothetical protein
MSLVVSDLLEDDLTRATYVEQSCYSDNVALRDDVASIAITFRAASSRNRIHGFPSLSFKVEFGAQLVGYLVAFQEPIALTQDDRIYKQRIYIADLAVLNRPSLLSARSASMLITSFLNRYVERYVDVGDVLPLVADVRRSTSGKLIDRKMASLANRAGLEARQVRRASFMMGADQMQRVVVIPTNNRIA